MTVARKTLRFQTSNIFILFCLYILSVQKLIFCKIQVINYRITHRDLQIKTIVMKDSKKQCIRNMLILQELAFILVHIFYEKSIFWFQLLFRLIIKDLFRIYCLVTFIILKKIMSQEQTSFPQFLSKNKQISPQENQKPQYQLQKFLSQQKQQLINKLSQINPNTDINIAKSENEQFTCFICYQYFVKAVTVKCGHSFCQQCLQEYFLFSKECPICQKDIRGSVYTGNNVLNQFIEGYIKSMHKDYIEHFQQRLERYKTWKLNDRPLGTNFRAGMSIDVRDDNFVWCKGTVIRVISRVGDPIKFLKVQYKNQNMITKQEEIKSNSQRLAIYGFYSGRKQIPKYKNHLLSSSKIKERSD